MVPEEDPEFQIAPMVDILLVLLIFFMSISSSEVLQTNQDVILPVAKDGRKPGTSEAKGQTIINVTWNPISNIGGIDMDEKKFTDPNMITGLLEPKVKVNDKMRVLIRADKNVRYEYLRAIMLASAGAGVGNVTFSVVDKDAPKAKGAAE
jgi:biopolymer transport protein ExbD